MINQNECIKTKLSPVSFGIAFGFTEGVFMLLFAWVGWLFGYGDALIQQIAGIYIGYAASFFGGILGGIWGFVDGFVFGIVAAAVYNFCLSRCKKSAY
jgi:hypothetical protein